MYSSPRPQCAINAARLLWVPLGKNNALSKPKRSATTRCNSLTVGSSPYTSSPTEAAAMAERMLGEGWVIVSLRRSIGGVGLEFKAKDSSVAGTVTADAD